MDGRLVVRWAFLARLTSFGLLCGAGGVMLLGAAPTVDRASDQVGVVLAGATLVAYVCWRVLRPRFVFDASAVRVHGQFTSREVEWSNVVAIRWYQHNSPYTGTGWAPSLIARDGRLAVMTGGQVPEYRMAAVNDWLREHQPEIRIDPKPPWRDRFGTWHVAEPGYDPVETMMSVRRSLVGPWEIVARSCDGGFRAEQRVVRSGVVVTREPVRETLAEAKADGVRLVREVVEAAASANE